MFEETLIVDLKEEAVKALQEIQKEWNEHLDTEMAHAKADEVLCHVLYRLGYSDIVMEWAEIEKWYS